MGDISKNFSFKEFECGCGCGTPVLSIDLVDKLQQVRDMYGKAMRITSGYRCPGWNEKSGGMPGSSHVVGEAADIYCSDSVERDALVGFLRTKFNRMGIDKNFIHVDISKTKASPVLWVY